MVPNLSTVTGTFENVSNFEDGVDRIIAEERLTAWMIELRANFATSHRDSGAPVFISIDDHAAHRSRAPSPEHAETLARAESLLHQGCALLEQDDARGAVALLEQCLGVRFGDTRPALRLQAAVLLHLGKAHTSLGNYEQAIECHTRAIATSRDAGDRRGERQSLEHLGVTYRNLGQYDKAIEQCTLALNLRRSRHREAERERRRESSAEASATLARCSAREGLRCAAHVLVRTRDRSLNRAWLRLRSARDHHGAGSGMAREALRCVTHVLVRARDRSLNRAWARWCQQLRAAVVVAKANGARRDAAHRAVILFASHAQRSEQRAWRCWMRFAHAHDLRKVTH